MLVKNIMVKNPIIIYEDENAAEAVERLEKLNIFNTPVLNKEEFPVGIFSRHFWDLNVDNPHEIKVKDALKPIGDYDIIKEFEEINMPRAVAADLDVLQNHMAVADQIQMQLLVVGLAAQRRQLPVDA